MFLLACGKSIEKQIAEQMELGQKYLEEMNYEEAVAAFQKVIQLDDKNVEAYLGLGQAFEKQAELTVSINREKSIWNYEQATDNYERIQELGPYNYQLQEHLISIYLEMGRGYFEQKDYEKAVLIFKKIIDLDDQKEEAYRGLAGTYEKTGDFKNVSNSIEQELRIVGRSNISSHDLELLINSYLWLVDEKAKSGDIKEAKDYLDKILELIPENEMAIRFQKILENKNELQEIVQTIIKDKKYNLLDGGILKDNLYELIMELEVSFIFQLEDGMYIGIYPGGYIYYGMMNNGMKNGQGNWFYFGQTQASVMSGNWDNDMPNGWAEIIIKSQTSMDYFKTDLKDGLFNGEVNMYVELTGEEINPGTAFEFIFNANQGLIKRLGYNHSNQEIIAYGRNDEEYIVCENLSSKIGVPPWGSVMWQAIYWNPSLQ